MTTFDGPCVDLTELVTDYMENALAPREQTEFEMHVVYCSSCSAFLGQMREIVDELGSLPADPIDVHDRDALLTALKSRR